MNRTRLSILSALLVVGSACSDDKSSGVRDEDGGSLPTAERDSGALPRADAGLVEGGLDGGQLVELDAAVVLPDGQVLVPDAATADASDGASSTLDSATSTPTTGNSGWVSYPDFEVDVVNKTAWTKPVEVVDDDELAAICPALTTGGFAWKLPQMEDVRKIAAGCAKTVPGGSCQVYLNEVTTANAGDCTCEAGLVGPNNGKFCRPEVPECETFWVWTHTNETGYYQHWFYDVKTGSIVTEFVAVGIANEAKGRCVHALTDEELAALPTP